MSFFEPPPEPPEPAPQPPRRPWHGASDAAIGKTIAVNLVVGRSSKAAVWIPSLTVYAEGFEFDVEIRHRLEETEFDHPFFLHHHHRRRRPRTSEEGLDPALVRFGIEFADGRKATNLGSRMPFALPGEPDTPPEGPLLVPSRGGGGGGGRWHHGFWVWPLPPDGPLAFVCEWPAADIPETRAEIDSSLIHGAAAEVIELWPESDNSGPGASGGTSFTMLQSMRSAPQPEGAGVLRREERWRELTIESERKTQLVDITDEVRELARGQNGSAVVVFVPHTTAGIVLQASGPDARRVAADIEAAFDRLVDESWPWQHTNEGDQNPWSHARSALTASSITIPLENGELALGELQRIFFCEFDGPRTRRVRLRVV